MLSPSSKLKLFPVAALFSATALQSAFAWEAEEVAERYKDLMGRQGVTLSWSDVSKDGDSVLFDGFKIALATIGKPVEIGEFALQNVSETDDTYEVGLIEVDSFEHTEDEATVALDGLEMTGVLIPKEGSNSPYAGITTYKTFALGSFKLAMGSNDVFSFNDLKADTGLQDNDGTMKFNANVRDFWVNLDALVKDAKGRSVIEEFGYKELNGHVDMVGDWRLEDGLMTISKYDIVVDKAGALGITGEVSGYTPDFIKTLQDMQNKMESATPEQKQAQGLAMLGLMQQLNLHGLSLRFDDASLTNKVLALVAKQQGVQPGDVANQAKAIVPLLAAQYLGSDLTQSLSKAVASYIDNPKNIEIRAAPPEPMPFAVLMGTAMGSPETLAKQVGLEVVANQ